MKRKPPAAAMSQSAMNKRIASGRWFNTRNFTSYQQSVYGSMAGSTAPRPDTRLLQLRKYEGRHILYGTWKHHDKLEYGKLYTLTFENRNGHITLLHPITQPYFNWRHILDDWGIINKGEHEKELKKRKELQKKNEEPKLPFRFSIK